MKKINKILFLFALSAAVFTTSCSNDDDNTGDSLVNFTSPRVTVAGMPSNDVDVPVSTMDGGAASVTVTASIAEPVAASLYIPLVQTGGSLSPDYVDLGEVIVIPAGYTSGSTQVTVMDSGMQDQTVTLSTGDNIENAMINPFSMTITIVNDIVVFDWVGSYSDGTNTYDFCDMDLDFLIYSGGVDTGNIDAQTGACPEQVVFDVAWADGEYEIYAYLWANPFSGMGFNAPVPITIGNVVASGFTTDSPVTTLLPVARVTKSGVNVTVAPF